MSWRSAKNPKVRSKAHGALELQVLRALLLQLGLRGAEALLQLLAKEIQAGEATSLSFVTLRLPYTGLWLKWNPLYNKRGLTPKTTPPFKQGDSQKYHSGGMNPL